MQQPDQVEIKRKPNSKTYGIDVRSRSRSRELRNSRLSFGPVQSQNGVVPVPVVVVVANSKSSKSGSGGNRVSSRKINDAINNSSIIKRRRRSASLRDDFNVSGTSGEENNDDDDDHDDDDEVEKKKRPRSKEQTAEEKSISADSPIDSARIRDTTGHTHKDKAPRQDASSATTPSTATGTTHVYTIPQLPRFNFIPATPLPVSPAAILEKQLGDHSIALLSTAITEEAGASTSAETTTTVAATATAETDTSDFQAADTDESKSKRPSMIRSSTLRDSRLHPWWRPRRGYYDYEDANLAKLLEGTAFDAADNGLEYSTSSKPPTPKTEWREYGPLKIDKKRKLVGVAGVQIQWVGLGGWYERFWGGKKDQKSEKENQEKSKENEKRKDEGKMVNGEKGRRRDSLAGSTRRGNTEGEQERNIDEDEIMEPQGRKVEIKKVSSSNRKVWISYEVPKSP